MIVIPPLDLTASSRITSTNAVEPDTGETAWNAATDYTTGSVVIRTGTHRTYERLAPGGTSASLPEATPAEWRDIGPTKAYRMFDTLRNSSTDRASPLTVVLTPGRRVNALALLGLQAQTVAVTVTSASAGGTVYSRTTSLQSRDTASWRDYFFGTFRLKTALILTDLPLYTDAVITVTISHASATVKCGAMVLGMSEFMGRTRLEATSDVLNFSTVDRDAAGNATMVQRRNVPVTKQNLFCDKALAPKLVRVRNDLNAIPAVWSSVDDMASDYLEPFLILGFYRKFLIDAKYPTQARVELELEEV